MKPYVVRRLGGWAVTTVVWVALGVAFLAWRDFPAPVWIVVLVVGFGALQTWQRTERFRAGPDGIRFALGMRGRQVAFASVPWSSVAEVLVAPSLSGPPEVAVCLRPGAPLPEGVPGVIHEPGATEGPIPDALRQVVPGLDPARLRKAAAAFAPDVRVSEGAISPPAAPVL